MKNSFYKGMITGMVIMCLLFAGGFSASKVMQRISDNKATELNSADEDNIHISDVIESEKLKSKYNLLSQYVDAYYLNKKDIESDEVVDGVLHGVVASLGDKYADYYNAEEYKEIMEDNSGEYGGIGTYVTQDKKTGSIILVNPFEGAPAYKAGLKAGDVLLKVDDKSVVGLSLDEVTSIMKGEAGTTVNIEINRDGKKLSFDVTREIVDVPTVGHTVIKDDNIGYVYISSFNQKSGQQFKEAVDELEKQKVDGIVIDLRNNGGGVLDAAIEVLDRVLPDGLVLYTETNRGRENEYFSDAESCFSKPYVVLINEYSASASEVVAGAIQDFGIGKIVGTTSYGKGVVQSVIPMKGVNTGEAVKLTTSKYFTPKGRNIDGIGIEPDIKVELDAEKKVKKSEVTVDNQLQCAIDALKK